MLSNSVRKIDSPQYKIILKEPVYMKSAYGKKRLVDVVVFRADQPEKLLETISAISNVHVE